MGDHQTRAFSKSEGDRYFERNRKAVFNVNSDPLVRLLGAADLRPASIIEIGAARGDRLAGLARLYDCRAVAVDPSSAASEEGGRLHPWVDYRVGTMDALPVKEAFDLVLVNFVFHWVGRDDLLRSVAEVDRVVQENGHLAIGDFLPPGPVMTPYHHQEGLWTYKQDYSGIFLASGLYCLVASLAGRYGGTVPSGAAAPNERAGFSLLHKSVAGHYLAAPPP